MSSESKHFKEGLAARREVLGAEYVDSSIAKADDFMMAFQHITTSGAGVMRGPVLDWIAKHEAC